MARTLSAIDRKHALVIPLFIKGLNDKDSSVRASAAEKLGMMGPRAGKALEDVIVALKDVDPLVRRASARALGSIASPASNAVIKALQEAADDEDERVRQAAAEALDQIRRKK